MDLGLGIWHFMDDKGFYCGRLRKSQGKWVFDPTSKTMEFSELAYIFGNHVTGRGKVSYY